jgi:GMP synthase (glutamine-hydrolysing)
VSKIIVFQHVPYEILGTLNPLLKEAGGRVRYVNYGRSDYPKPDVSKYDALIVLGGPMGAYETVKYPHLSEEMNHIREMIERGKPVLGICLGAQLIAAALGAEVRRHHTKEIGWYKVKLTAAGKKDILFSHFAPSEDIFQWHGDTFELPDGATHLAKTKSCHQQAFRYSDNVYGFQFHMEVDEEMIERWLLEPRYVSELRDGKGSDMPQTIRRETPRKIGRLKTIAKRTFLSFIDLIGF